MSKIGLSVLAILAVLVSFSGCSGAFGDDGLHLYIAQLDNSRYISSSATTGYVVVAKKDKVFSVGSVEVEDYQEFEDGYLTIKGLPVGDYTLIVVLTDSGGAVGFKAKDITIERGPQTELVVLGPGITSVDIGLTDYAAMLYDPTVARNFPDVQFWLGTDTVYIRGTGYSNGSDVTLNWETAGFDSGTPSGNSNTFNVTDPEGTSHSFTVTLLD